MALQVWGRAFDGFVRAVEAHAAAWPVDDVEPSWFGLRELQDAVLGASAPDADIVVVPADWLPALAASERVRPVTDYVERRPPHGWPTAWSPSFHRGVTWDGDVYGLPFHDGPQVQFTRPSLLAAQNLRTPTTWSQWVAAVARVQDHVTAGTVLAGAPDGHNNVYDLVLHLWRFGGDLVDQAGRPVLDGAPMRAALRFLRTVATTAVPPDAHQMDSNASGAAFADGRVGLAVNWAGYAASAAAGTVADDVGYALAPAHDDGSPTITVNAFWVACITTACSRPDDAWDYLRHAASPEMDRLTTAAGASGTRRSTWSAPDVLAAHPEYALFEAAHAASRPLPRVAALPALVDVLSELADAVVWRGEPMEDALVRAQRSAAALFEGALR